MRALILANKTSSPFCTENYGRVDIDDVTTLGSDVVYYHVTASASFSFFGSSQHALFTQNGAVDKDGFLNNTKIASDCYYELMSTISQKTIDKCVRFG